MAPNDSLPVEKPIQIERELRTVCSVAGLNGLSGSQFSKVPIPPLAPRAVMGCFPMVLWLYWWVIRKGIDWLILDFDPDTVIPNCVNFCQQGGMTTFQAFSKRVKEG